MVWLTEPSPEVGDLRIKYVTGYVGGKCWLSNGTCFENVQGVRPKLPVRSTRLGSTSQNTSV